MAAETRNNAAATRGQPFGKGHPGKPFAKGNPGRPHGARHKATLAAEALLDGEAKALTRKAVEMAMTGDAAALRLCLERILPRRNDRPMSFDIGRLEGPEDALAAVSRLVEALAAGEVTPSEASAAAGVLESYRRTYEATMIEGRLAALEKRL